MPITTRLQSGNSSLIRRLGYKPNVPVPQNYLNAPTPTSKERSETLAATATNSTLSDRTPSNLLPPQFPPPPPPTEMDTEPAGVSDEIGLQNGTITADPSSTELYIPPSPARSSLYATATHTISPAGAITTTTSTSLQPVMITLPTPASVHQTMPSSSQQLPFQHHSLPEHQTALTGQYTYIPPAPATYQLLVPVQVPVQSQISTPTPPPPRANINLEKYDGKTSAIQFWTQFMTFISIMNVPLDAAHIYFSFYLKDTAKDWYFQLAPVVQNSLSELKSAFLARFKPQAPFSLGLVNITQQNTESVDQYISRIRKLSTDSTMPEDCLTTMIMKGLKPAIRNIVMPHFPQTIDDLWTKSAIAEMTVLMNNQSLSTETSDNSVVNAMSAVCDVTTNHSCHEDKPSEQCALP